MPRKKVSEMGRDQQKAVMSKLNKGDIRLNLPEVSSKKVVSKEPMEWQVKFYFDQIENPKYGKGSSDKFTTAYSLNKNSIKQVFKDYNMNYIGIKQEWSGGGNYARWLGAHAEPISLYAKGNKDFLNDLHNVIKEILEDKENKVTYEDLTKLSKKEVAKKVEEAKAIEPVKIEYIDRSKFTRQLTNETKCSVCGDTAVSLFGYQEFATNIPLCYPHLRDVRNNKLGLVIKG